MAKKPYLFQQEENYYKLLQQKNFLFHLLVEEVELVLSAELKFTQVVEQFYLLKRVILTKEKRLVGIVCHVKLL